MVGRKPSLFWQITWRFISPLVVFVILVFYLVTQAQQKLTYSVWDPDSVSPGINQRLLHSPQEQRNLLCVVLASIFHTSRQT